jgi:hypothetical protein
MNNNQHQAEHWQATLSDGSTWTEFDECSLLPELSGKE